MIGLLVGVLIGYSNIRKWLSRLLIFLYFSTIFFLQFILFLSNHNSWNEGLFTYIDRITKVVNQLIENVPVSDGILFSSGAGLIFLFISLVMGYQYVRYRKIGFPFFANLALFVLIQFHIPHYNRSYLVIFLFVFLLLLFFQRNFLLKKRYEWIIANIRENEDELYKIFRKNLLIIIFICLFSIGLPNFQNYIYGIGRGQVIIEENERGSISNFLDNFFNPLSDEQESAQEFFLDNLTLGTDIPRTRQKVFEVSAESVIGKPPRYYWRGKAYSSYEKGKWFSENEIRAVYPDTGINQLNEENQIYQEFSLIFSKPVDILPIPQYVRNVDVSVQFSFYHTGENYKDLISIGDEFANYKNKDVSYFGAYNQANYEELQNSASDYPDWVEERYLQLPDRFSEKIRRLSKEITEDKPTNIEKVLAITNFLRNSYRYSDKVFIPENHDPIEWFLLEGREGFCNYFASAETLMLRSVGIPARLVSGYSQGERDLESNKYFIYVLNRHAWVEVFFPNIGWIIFEPTPNQPQSEFFIREGGNRREVPGTQDGSDFENYQLRRGIPIQSEIDEIDRNNNFFNPTGNNQTKRYLIWSGTALLSLMLLFTIINWFVIKEEKNIAPMILKTSLEKVGKEIPEWIEKWDNYENLKTSEKYYLRLKKISRVILKMNSENSTPSEFLSHLFTQIHLSGESADLFTRSYLRDAYGEGIEEDYSGIRSIYCSSVGLVFRSLIKETLRKFASRFKPV